MSTRQIASAHQRVLGLLAYEALTAFGLTKKEHDVAFLLLKGFSCAEIGALTQITLKTAKQHIGRIYAKAEVHTHAEFLHAVFPL